MIRGHTQGQYDLAIRTLMWVTYAHRPLNIHELRHALAIRISERHFDEDNLPSVKSVLKCCSGLIVMDHQSLEVRLVHFTLQDYVQSQARCLFTDAEIAIALTCLTYMMLEIDVEEEVSPRRISATRGSNTPQPLHLSTFPF